MGKLKRVVLVVVATAGIGAASASVIALRAYDEATKIDRTTPSVVVREYVEAYLVRRDDQRAGLFVCGSPLRLDDITTLRSQLLGEERAGGVTTQVVPARLTESNGGRLVTAELKINQGGGLHTDRRTQYWQFTMVDEDGWRVCGAEQLPDPSPSPSATPSATPPTAG